MKRFHKFNAKRTEIDGIKFSSSLESKYYQYLNLLIKSGEVVFFLRQVPIHITGGKYICDYQIFWYNGEVEFVDVKGFMTPLSKLKIKQVEELYPFKITIVKKGDF